MPDFFKAVGAARFGVMAGVAAVLTAFFLYIAGAITEPPKTILFGGLDPRDAAAVTAKLDAMTGKYDAKDDGTILVPADQVTKLRMALAQDNLPAAGVGYEIFDKSDAFGTTAFVQNINSLRALEGELARSIQTIDGVESARVHLVIPERQVFSRDDQTPSASVVLKTRAVMGRGQVEAVQHLVAAAVASLTPDRVAIVDDRGNLLAGGDDKSAPGATAANQEQNTTDYEDRLRQRIEGILSSMVGPGHVRVQVTADMNYNQVNTTEEKFDPDTKVVRSTQTVEQKLQRQLRRRRGGGIRRQRIARRRQRSAWRQRQIELPAAPKKPPITKSARPPPPPSRMAATSRNCRSPWWWTATAPQAAQRRRHGQDQQPGEIRHGLRQTRGDQIQVTNMPFAKVDIGDATPAAKPLLGLDPRLLVQDHRSGDHVRHRAADRPVRRPPADQPHVRRQQRRRPRRHRSPMARRSRAPCPRPAGQPQATPTPRAGALPAPSPAHRHQPHRRPGQPIVGEENR